MFEFLKNLIGKGQKSEPPKTLSDSAMREINDPTSLVGRLLSTAPEKVIEANSSFEPSREPSNRLLWDSNSRKWVRGALPKDTIGELSSFGEHKDRSISAEDAWKEGDMLSGASLKRSAFNAGYLPPNSDIFDDYSGLSKYFKKEMNIDPNQMIVDRSTPAYNPQENLVTIPINIFDRYISNETSRQDFQNDLANSLAHEMKHAEDGSELDRYAGSHFNKEPKGYSDAVSGRNHINRYAALKRLMELK
jgi:hypothetical protein